MRSSRQVTAAYRLARDVYAEYGIDTESALRQAAAVPISLQCWQADDVHGLETHTGAVDGGGIMATGSYPGRARNGDDMRRDLEQVLDLLPGTQRVNLHASYAETGTRPVDRDALTPAHFSRWMDWARSRKLSLDFNPTYFAHPLAASGLTLSHPDADVRRFWIRHGRASRRIADAFAKAQGGSCVNNHWVPDGMKDLPADRWSPRARLRESYDAIFSDRSVDPKRCLDAVEGKLFGLGSEEYVVGSHEFYAAYALQKKLMPCLDLGHYHPTESVADKVSALLQFHPRLLLHTSRPVRWDSDHVVIFDDAVRALFLEIARGAAWKRVYVALDFFDASINRIAAYVIGARATRQAIVTALLDPQQRLREAEAAGWGHERLAIAEAAKALPWGAVWDELCRREDVPVGDDWLVAVSRYQRRVLDARS